MKPQGSLRRRRDLTPESIALIEAQGSISGNRAKKKLQALGDQCLGEGCPHLILDLSEARDCCSELVNEVVRLAIALRDRGGALVLVRPQRYVLDFLKQLGCEKVCARAESITEAQDTILGPVGASVTLLPQFPRSDDGFMKINGLELRIRSRPTRELAVLEFRGYLGGNEEIGFGNVFRSFIDQGIRRVIVDCSGLKYVNSGGLSVLVMYADRLRDLGGALILASLAQKVNIVIDMLGLDAFFFRAGSIADALARFGHPFEESEAPRFPDLHPPFLEGHEPLFDWEYFVRQRPDGEREGVLINTAIREQAPMSRRPYLLALRVPFREANAEAILTPTAETERFRAIQKALLPLMLTEVDGRLSSRRTDRRGITWVFYGGHPADGDRIIHRLFERLPGGWSRDTQGAELYVEEDPQWLQYFAILRLGIAPQRLALT